MIFRSPETFSRVKYMRQSQKNSPVFVLALCASLVPLLCGCSNVRNTLGLNKDAPDEFAVVRRAPLEIPPGLTAAALPPPRPGMQRPQESTPSEEAREALIGSEDSEGSFSKEPSASEDLLLQKTHATDTDPAIRRTIDQETAELKDRNKPVIKKLTGLGNSDEDSSATVVDAKKEYERLKKNEAAGKPATEGETPYIDE